MRIMAIRFQKKAFRLKKKDGTEIAPYRHTSKNEKHYL
jgi:hypothetical protein